MGVLKNLQNLSDLEFYKCAEKLQDDITDFCLRNFGLKKSPRNVNQIIKDISEEDQSEINKIFEKYGKTPNQQYASEYPEWFIDNRKRRLLAYTDDLIDFIIEANTIYPTTLRECDDRRSLQNKAIGICGKIYRDLQYLKRHLPINLNWLAGTIEQVKREEKLLKGWRQSDNKTRKTVFTNTIKELTQKLEVERDDTGERMKWLAAVVQLLRH